MGDFIVLWLEFAQLYFQWYVILFLLILCQRPMFRKDLLPDLLNHSFILELALCILVVPRTWNVDSIAINLKSLDSWSHDLLSVIKWISHLFLRTIIGRSRIWDFIESFRFENTGLGLVTGFVHDCVHEGSNPLIRKRRSKFLSRSLCLFIQLITPRSHIRRNHRLRPTKPFLPIFRPINNCLMLLPNGFANIIIPSAILSDLDIVFNIEWLDVLGIVRVAQ